MTTPQTSGATQYVYGIIRADASIPDDLTGVDDQPVSLVAHGPCAALVSDLAQQRPLGERADLLAHQRVLDVFVSAGVDILPFRFGAALGSREAVEKELLTENGERLSQVLDGLKGRQELRVKATYVQEAILREVMTEEPEVAELNERVRNVPEDASDAVYYDRVRLGELVAQSVKRRRDEEGARLLDGLAPAASAVAAHPPVREEDVLDASFLVERGKLADFQRAVDALAGDTEGRLTLRLVGPLPPYSFVPEE
ncbi:GvpL/GvpF family gas vesicle protein [Actinoallomurus iriomotensis]|uniref:Gas vesicle protein n=1 Tax=Actinoallomurus iriomotensis TaxID=478107 RepID=A0A9W6RUR5_9ACTN|nr:GvpL/GvpF family gas vesicle protein [Actinoallomurus iriomotensis]GLY82200.1 gas vesicle protein [Actinoallomurus iriomotensis]